MPAVAVLLLAGRNRQGERVEDQIHGSNAVFFGRQIVNALGDGDLFFGRERHAIFVDGERNDRGPEALGHGQHFGGALLTVFQVDGVDDRLCRECA